MPATGWRIGHPASISDSVAPHTDAIDDEPLLSRTSLTTRSVYGNSLVGRDHRDQRALGEVAVADLAAARAADRLDLAGAVRREVVLEVELLRVLLHQAVDDLLVAERAERRDHEGLRLAAGEEGRAVRARQEAGLDRDRPDVALAALVDAAAVERHLAHDLVLGLGEALLDLLQELVAVVRGRSGASASVGGLA